MFEAWDATRHLHDRALIRSRVQVTYAMGASGRSYIVGFGRNPPRQPHHRNAALTFKDSNNWDVFNNTSRPNAHTITGALVGGPGLKVSVMLPAPQRAAAYPGFDFQGCCASQVHGLPSMC